MQKKKGQTMLEAQVTVPNTVNPEDYDLVIGSLDGRAPKDEIVVSIGEVVTVVNARELVQAVSLVCLSREQMFEESEKADEAEKEVEALELRLRVDKDDPGFEELMAAIKKATAESAEPDQEEEPGPAGEPNEITEEELD